MPHGWNVRVRPYNLEQGKIRRHIVGSGVYTYLQQRCRGCRRQIDDRISCVVPTPWRSQTARSAKVEMPADSPHDHLDKHAFVDLYKQFPNDSAARIGAQQGERCPAAKPGMLRSQPG